MYWQSAIRATEQALYDLNHPLSLGSVKSIEVQRTDRAGISPKTSSCSRKTQAGRRASHNGIGGLFSGVGYIVESNYESGLGRPDLMIKDRKKRSAVIIEVKVTNSQALMEQECRKQCLAQI